MSEKPYMVSLGPQAAAVLREALCDHILFLPHTDEKYFVLRTLITQLGDGVASTRDGKR